MKHYFRIIGLIIISPFLIYGCEDENEEVGVSFILAHAMHTDHPVSIAMDQMVDRVDELSGGEIRIQVYPAGQLGSERELLELIQIGTIGMTKVSAASMENIVPAMQVFSLPYLFRDKEHVFNVLDGDIGRELLDEGTPYRLKGLAYYDAGSRSLYTVDQPVRTPADLRGQKIRVMESVIAMELMQTMGGAPTPISYGELYTAFQGGIVDGAENNPPSFYTSRHYEVVDYYTLNEHATIPDLLVVGTHIWDKLNRQQREWLQQAIDESVEFQRELWEESEHESLEIVEEAGVEIIRPDLEPFREALQPMYDRIEQRNPALYEWVERIRQVE